MAGVKKRLTTYAEMTWRGLGSYRDADINRFVELMVPRVLAGQRQVAGLADAYIAAVTGVRSLGVDPALVTGAAVRVGADPDAVYRRPAVEVYTALAAGTPLDAAIAQGANRLKGLVGTDLQLAKRGQVALSMQAGNVQRYVRVLTGAEDCDLCTIASTNTYSTADLLPIHNLCDCDVDVADQGSSAARSLNPDRSAVDASRDATSGRGDVIVREHGEYGPVLTFAGDDFTGPGDIAA